MELLFGLEPLTALAVGVGALVVVPAIAAVNSAVGESLSETSRNLAKSGLSLSFDAVDKTQTFFHEVGESFQDLVAEAKAEQIANKRQQEQSQTSQSPMPPL